MVNSIRFSVLRTWRSSEKGRDNNRTPFTKKNNPTWQPNTAMRIYVSKALGDSSGMRGAALKT